jgi:hypothetical protein
VDCRSGKIISQLVGFEPKTSNSTWECEALLLHQFSSIINDKTRLEGIN